MKTAAIASFSILLVGMLVSNQPQTITLGLVHYQPPEEDISLQVFKKALEREIPNLKVQVTGTTNYEEGAELICGGNWDISFAMSPIVAAQAVECGHIPIFQAYGTTDGTNTYRSALFVRSDSPLAQDFNPEELGDKKLALNQPGSASGYYFPIHYLCGTTVEKIAFLGGYDDIKQAVVSGEFDLGAGPDIVIENDELFPQGTFTIVAKTIAIPNGAIIANPQLTPELIAKIKQVMAEIPSEEMPRGSGGEPIIATNAPIPNYQIIANVISTVDSLGEFYQDTPVVINCPQ